MTFGTSCDFPSKESSKNEADVFSILLASSSNKVQLVVAV
jgi:hypothetical protein